MTTPTTTPTGTCVQCRAHWGGLKTAHCSECHQTFTAITAFDKHRTGSHPLSTRHCLDPATIGLIDAGRAYPCWGAPGRDAVDDE